MRSKDGKPQQSYSIRSSAVGRPPGVRSKSVQSGSTVPRCRGCCPGSVGAKTSSLAQCNPHRCAIRPTLEDGQERDRFTIVAVAAVVAQETTVGGRQEPGVPATPYRARTPQPARSGLVRRSPGCRPGLRSGASRLPTCRSARCTTGTVPPAAVVGEGLACRPWPIILGMTREHVVIEHERVLVRKKLGHPHRRGGAVTADSIEHVIFRDFAAGAGSDLSSAATDSICLRSSISRCSSASRAAR